MAGSARLRASVAQRGSDKARCRRGGALAGPASVFGRNEPIFSPVQGKALGFDPRAFSAEPPFFDVDEIAAAARAPADRVLLAGSCRWAHPASAALRRLPRAPAHSGNKEHRGPRRPNAGGIAAADAVKSSASGWSVMIGDHPGHGPAGNRLLHVAQEAARGSEAGAGEDSTGRVDAEAAEPQR